MKQVSRVELCESERRCIHRSTNKEIIADSHFEDLLSRTEKSMVGI